MSLTQQELKKIWKNELLVEVRKEIRKESDSTKAEMAAIIKKLGEIEDSQKFLSNKYDTLLTTLQEVKKQTRNNEGQMNEVNKEIDDVKRVNYDLQVQLDEVQQYSRRDTLEICGIPVTPNDNPKKLIVEMANLVDVKLEDDDISVAHRLPPTKKVKDRIIVKFTRRETKDLIYNKRGKLKVKKTKDLPTVRAEPESSDISHKAQIHINESLTPYRKRLFGKILEFKRKNSYKYIWTMNGKILLRASDHSPSSSFVTYEQFEDYVDNVAQF